MLEKPCGAPFKSSTLQASLFNLKGYTSDLTFFRAQSAKCLSSITYSLSVLAYSYYFIVKMRKGNERLVLAGQKHGSVLMAGGYLSTTQT